MSDPEEVAAAPLGPPSLIVFDVNETLSDMRPLREAFEGAGLRADEVEAWFAGLLRDAFALTTVGVNPGFAEIATESLRIRLLARGKATGQLDSAVDAVMTSFTTLTVHPDVAQGVRALRDDGVRMVTLSNGSASVAAGLLQRAGLEARLNGCSAWRARVPGSRTAPPMPTHSTHVGSRRRRRCWWRSTRGTSTERHGQVFVPAG